MSQRSDRWSRYFRGARVERYGASSPCEVRGVARALPLMMHDRNPAEVRVDVVDTPVWAKDSRGAVGTWLWNVCVEVVEAANDHRVRVQVTSSDLMWVEVTFSFNGPTSAVLEGLRLRLSRDLEVFRTRATDLAVPELQEKPEALVLRVRRAERPKTPPVAMKTPVVVFSEDQVFTLRVRLAAALARRPAAMLPDAWMALRDDEDVPALWVVDLDEHNPETAAYLTHRSTLPQPVYTLGIAMQMAPEMSIDEVDVVEYAPDLEALVTVFLSLPV